MALPTVTAVYEEEEEEDFAQIKVYCDEDYTKLSQHTPGLTTPLTARAFNRPAHDASSLLLLRTRRFFPNSGRDHCQYS